MITINIVGRSARVVDKDIITTGSVGAQVGFTFDDEWDGLVKVATFRCGSLHYDQTIINGKCVIPHEVLANVGETLEIGVYGSSVANTTVTVRIPTVWCVYGKVKEGAAISNATSTAATPNAVEQMLSYASSCADDASDALTSASNAEGYADQAARSALAAAAAAAGKQDALTAEGYVAIGSDNSIDLSSGTQDWIRSTGMSVSQLEAAVQFINRELLPGKQDKLTAGNAITISGDTIGVTAGVFGSAADVQDAYDRAVYASNVGVTQAARVTTLIDNKEDKLVAGSGITLVTTQTGTSTEGVPIKRTTISATGGGGGGSYDDTELRTRITTIEGKETEWDANTTARHTHSNKAILDFITSDKISSWDGKSDFDGDYDSLTNKPTIPVVPTADINANTQARHTHSNKSALDGITSDKVSSWDGKSDFDGNYISLTNKPIYIAVYGTTTVDEVSTALSEGKAVWLSATLDGKAFTFYDMMVSDNNYAWRVIASNTEIRQVYFKRSNGTWSNSTIPYTPPTDDYINGLIDAKINGLETQTARIVSLVGDEVTS